MDLDGIYAKWSKSDKCHMISLTVKFNKTENKLTEKKLVVATGERDV